LSLPSDSWREGKAEAEGSYQQTTLHAGQMGDPDALGFAQAIAVQKPSKFSEVCGRVSALVRIRK
jgi:hypothetical protein